MTAPHVLYVQIVTPDRRIPPSPAQFEAVLDLAADLTPVIEQLPPDALLLDVAGGLRFFNRTAAELGARLRVRSLARHDLDITVGAATNRIRLVRRIRAGRAAEPDGRWRTVEVRRHGFVSRTAVAGPLAERGAPTMKGTRGRSWRLRSVA